MKGLGNMKDQAEILADIKKLLVNGKLQCAVAHCIAKEQDIKLADIGRVCEENNIRISSCELGCF